MKHRLFRLCLALISFMIVDKAAASLHLKQNPTQLEPGSYALSGESYQIAKVTWLPDYLGKNKSYGKDRVNDGGKDISGRNCARYGFVDSCGEGTGTIVHPTVGLTCYKNCKASCSSLGYVDKCSSTQTGTAVTTEDGSTCYKDCKCPITYRYTTSADLTPKMLGRAAFVSYCASPALVSGEKCSQTYVNTTTSQTETAVLYKECNCPSEYNSNLQVNGSCTPCTDGKGVTQYACVANCDNYPLTECPPGGTCYPCPIDNSKLQLYSCDTEKGWLRSMDDLTCPKKDCPSGFTAGVTSCTSGSTKPDLTLNGWSGGQECGMCSCKNVNSNCTAANYPLTTLPANAKYETCNTGCGSEKVDRYIITSCNDGYKQSNGACRSDSCTSGSPNITCSSSQRKVEVSTTDAGTPCYKCECIDGYKLVGSTCLNDTCTSGSPDITCSSSQRKVEVSTTDAGTPCYKCECIDGYKLVGSTCLNDICPNGSPNITCSSSQRKVEVSPTDAGTKCYKCEEISIDCSVYQKYPWVKGSCSQRPNSSDEKYSETCGGITYNLCLCKTPFAENKDGSECICPLPKCPMTSDSVTTLPANSEYVTETCTDCENTNKVIKTGWRCKSGYVKSKDNGGIYKCYDVRKNLSGGGKSDGSCTYGDILFSDRTCAYSAVTNKTPIGVIIKGARLPSNNEVVADGLAIALTEIGQQMWANATTNASIFDTIGATANNSSGKVLTEAIMMVCKNNGISCPAFENVLNFTTVGTRAGEWHILSKEEWSNILRPSYSTLSFKDLQDKLLYVNAYGGASAYELRQNSVSCEAAIGNENSPGGSTRYGFYWTSSWWLYNGGAYSMCLNGDSGQTSPWHGITDSYKIRPAIEFAHGYSCVFHTLDNCPSNANCSFCGNARGQVKHRIDSCKSGYSAIWKDHNQQLLKRINGKWRPQRMHLSSDLFKNMQMFV